jgi:Flp pilus assembly protein CpaB
VLRRRIRYWPVTAALSVVAGLAAASFVGQAESAARSAGDRRVVAVARRELPIGHVIGDHDVERRAVPESLLDTPVVDDPVGRVVDERVLPSEPLFEPRLAPPGPTGTGTLVPTGWRAIAIPSVGPQPPVRIGDRVDVLGMPLVVTTRADTVAHDAIVVAVDEHSVTVAVEADDLARTARAVIDGAAILALVSTIGG